MAYDNNDPLVYKNAQDSERLYRITEKTENEMKLVQITSSPHSVPTFLGAIVSTERQTIYWVNNTKPLP